MAVSQLTRSQRDRTVIDNATAHTVSQRLRQLKNIPTEIWPLSTSLPLNTTQSSIC
jgi:hypothetical protein